MFKLPELNFNYNALEPYIDEATMKIHHTKHHQAYLDKLNAILKDHPDLAQKPIQELLVNLDSLPKDLKQAVRSHGGGHANHSFFWEILSPNKQKPNPIINKEEFTQATLSVFGSGWTWAVADSKNQIKIITTPNQDSPVSQGLKPILGLDVWEHAYYLKYQNNRAKYVEAFWNIINWSQVEKNLNDSNV